MATKPNGEPAAFLPEYLAVPTSQGWRPSFRLFAGERERLVPYKDGPRFFPSKTEAESAAKDHVRPILNAPIYADQRTEISEIEAWRAKRDAQAEKERVKVFGQRPRAIVRDCAGNEVKVETRRARV